jgi:tRNA(fMet)-specific endonuclease VapC
MSGNPILDTNVVIGIMNHDPKIDLCVRDFIDLCIPAVVLGELYFGAFRSQKVDRNLTEIEQFLAGATVFGIDRGTAHWYGQIKQQLSRAGTPIPANDIWIAATAMQHDAAIVTLDSHFSAVKDLSIIRP